MKFSSRKFYKNAFFSNRYNLTHGSRNIIKADTSHEKTDKSRGNNVNVTLHKLEARGLSFLTATKTISHLLPAFPRYLPIFGIDA